VPWFLNNGNMFGKKIWQTGCPVDFPIPHIFNALKRAKMETPNPCNMLVFFFPKEFSSNNTVKNTKAMTLIKRKSNQRKN